MTRFLVMWKPMCVSAYGFQALFNFRFQILKTICVGFPSLKTHVRWCIWFSSFFQFWIFELENPCVLMHMVFKLFSTLDFRAWKPMCVNAYGFQALFNFRFWILKTICIGFSSLKTHVCWHVWFLSSLQLWIFELEN
jgi:hypothetical protein